jgi:hypothetical protein
MAIISIPHSVGGVAIPGGLLKGPLSSLFGNGNRGADTIFYPSDLAANPARGHLVLFTIKEVTPLNVEEKVTAVVDKGLVNNTIASALKTPVNQIKDTIALYMPDTLSMSYSADYQDFSLTDSLGVAGKLASAAQSAYDGYKSGGFDQAKKNLAPAAAEAAGALSKAAGIKDGGDILLKSIGRAVNPQAQLLYKGVGLRQFQLEFLFTPSSKEEAETVTKIIDTFNWHFHPSLGDAVKGDEGQYFIMPSVFNLQFNFTGSDSAKDAIINSVLGNLGPLGSAISAASATVGNENTSIFKVGDCVLESMEVNYAPNGWAAHMDGAPVQTSLTLGFKEMNIVHRGILRQPGGSKDLKGKVR